MADLFSTQAGESLLNSFNPPLPDSTAFNLNPPPPTPEQILGSPAQMSAFIGTPSVSGAGNLANAISRTDSIAASLFGLSGADTFGSSAANTAAASAASSSTGFLSEISDFFLRSVVIIVGFIFLAIGLSMFKNSSPVLSEAHETVKHKVAKTVTKLAVV